MKYFVHINGQIEGPFSFIEITRKQILEDTMICTDASDGGWKEAREYTEFLHLFQTSGAAVDEQAAPPSQDNPVNVQPPQPTEPVPESQQQPTESAAAPQYQVTQLPVGYEIDEFGQIIRKDYAFQSAKKRPEAPLPTNRGYLGTIAITIVTCGIYGIILPFLMAEETNITCSEDGEHTPDSLKSVILSLITLGIYGCFWKYNWCNREANFLRRHKSIPLLTGRAYVGASILSVALIIIGALCIGMNPGAFLVLVGIVFLWAVIGRMTTQHNLVNKAYNVENFLLEQDSDSEDLSRS